MTRSRDAMRPSRASLSFGGGLAKSVSIGDDEDDEDVEPLLVAYLAFFSFLYLPPSTL